MRVQMTTVASTFLVAVLLAACDGPAADPPSAPPPSATHAFPYPPVQYYTEVAVPLAEPVRSAAKFALDMKVADYGMLDPRENETYRAEFRSKIAPEANKYVEPFTSPDFVDDTGGLTLRAVDARELSDGIIEVSVCSYRSPGVFVLHKDGHISGPIDDPYTLTRPRVQWTDRRAADGSVPVGPRWLWVDSGIDLTMTNETEASVCEQFKPNPFTQKMPDPTTPTPTPTR